MSTLFGDQVVPAGKNGCVLENLPLNWTGQSECVKTVELSGADSKEWKMCNTLVQKTLKVTVVKVIRIQNLWLWEAYDFNKARMAKRNSGRINEMYLFHGTSTTDPMEIACGEDGFDIRQSKGGKWGKAVYFAESAKYSDKFAYYTPSGDKEIIVSQTLIGEAFDHGTLTNRVLKFPPIREDDLQTLRKVKYDSVSAICNNTRVYMLYDNYKAYPLYLVRYRT